MAAAAAIDDDILAAARAAFGEDAVRLLAEELPAPPAAGKSLDELVAKLDARFAAAPAAPSLDAARLARRREAASLVRCVVAQVGGMRWALRMDHIVEIVAPPPTTPLPGLPEWALGIANLRGDIASVIDLAAFLHLRPGADRTAARVVLARNAKADVAVGLLVDRVEGARGLPLDKAQAGGLDLPERLARFVSGALPQPGGTLLALDLDRLLNDPELRRFDGEGN